MRLVPHSRPGLRVAHNPCSGDVFVNFKKLKQRRQMLWWLVASLVCFDLGVSSTIHSLTHHGPGMLPVGGPSPEGSGAPDTDETREQFPESEYRRQCRIDAVFFLLLGGWTMAEFVSAWRKRNAIEAHWTKIISYNLPDVHKHPDAYRDDFKQWIKDNHPHLTSWMLPPNSKN